MTMKPLAGLLLALACLLGIAATGSVFELAYGDPDLGATTTTVAPARHDEIVAHISHLPQILASTLCAFLAQRDPAWRDFAGGGLRDTTRIAGSDPQLWRTILEQNRTEVLGALQHYQAELNRFEKALVAGDYAALTEQLQRGQDYRRGLRPAS